MRIPPFESVRAAAALALVATAACYTAAPLPGAPCPHDSACPDGQQCIAGRCALDGAVATADRPDARAAPPSDAAAPPSADATGAADCRPAASCQLAALLGAVSGDTDQPTVSAQGNRGAWFRIRVTEDDDFEGHPLRVVAALTPPAGAAFDVAIHVGDCGAAATASTASGATRRAAASWGEDVVPNGEDDSRDVWIEVRPPASCTPGATWQLTVEGNRS